MPFKFVPKHGHVKNVHSMYIGMLRTISIFIARGIPGVPGTGHNAKQAIMLTQTDRLPWQSSRFMKISMSMSPLHIGEQTSYSNSLTSLVLESRKGRRTSNVDTEGFKGVVLRQEVWD